MQTKIPFINLVKLSLFIFFCLIFSIPALSQEIEYTVKGRVVDGNGMPQAKISVRLCSIKDTWQDNYLTTENGEFTITQKHKKGKIWYLFVTDAYNYSKNGWTLIHSASE